METDGFKLYFPRKKRKYNIRKNWPHVPAKRNESTIFDIHEALIWAAKNDYVAVTTKLILRMANTLSHGRKIAHFEIYGNGAFDAPGNGAVQMSSILYCKEVLSIPSVVFQEPVMSYVEHTYLKSADIKARTETEIIEHFDFEAPGDDVILVYMIHCDWCVLCDFLTLHWKPNHLSRIILVGNSLKDLHTHPYYRDIPYLVKLFSQMVDEYVLPQVKDVNAFSNTSVMTLNFEKALKVWDR